MKKLSILLALMLVIGMLAACNSEGAAGQTTYEVPGYLVTIPAGDGWTTVEDSLYDLELTKNNMKIYVRAYSADDFVDPPLAEDLYFEEMDGLLATLTDTAEKEARTEYTANGKTTYVSMHSGKEGDSNKLFYCFLVEFEETTGTWAWVCFSAEAKVMDKQKSNFKAMVDGMVCTNTWDPEADPFDDGLEFDENGELITDETEPEDVPYDTEEAIAPEENPPAPTEEEGPTATTEAVTEATEATTEATEATEATKGKK